MQIRKEARRRRPAAREAAVHAAAPRLHSSNTSLCNLAQIVAKRKANIIMHLFAHRAAS